MANGSSVSPQQLHPHPHHISPLTFSSEQLSAALVCPAAAAAEAAVAVIPEAELAAAAKPAAATAAAKIAAAAGNLFQFCSTRPND